MFKDPENVWRGPYPYDVLAAVGVTPATTHADMQDVSFELMIQGLMTPETQTAWHELRTLRTRLLADLVLWDVDLAAEAAGARRALDAALRQDPGEPPEVARCLTPGYEDLATLADRLDGVPLPPPPPAPPGDPVPPELWDELIRFEV